MNKWFFRAILIVILVSAFSGAFAVGFGNEYWTAMEHIAHREYAEGVKSYYKFLLKSNPAMSIPSRQKDMASAFAYFKKLSATSPSDSSVKLFLSLVFRITENWKYAELHLNEALKRHPSSFMLLFIKGELLLAMGRIDEAKEAFQKLKTIPRASKLAALADFLMKRRGIGTNASARRSSLLQRAYRYLDLTENAKAEATFRLVIREFPDEVEGYRALIDLFAGMGRFDDADRVLDTLRKAGGTKVRIPLQEARLRYFQKRFQDVVTILTPLEEREQANDYFVFFLAESCFNIGKFDKSAVLFHRLVKNDPENLGFILREAASFEGMGSRALAAQVLKRELNRHSDSGLVRMELGNLLERMNRLEEAKTEYQNVADSDSPFRLEAKSKLENIVAKLVEEEKQRLARSLAEQKRRIGSADISSESVPVSGSSEDGQKFSEDGKFFQAVVRQQRELSKRLERLSD